MASVEAATDKIVVKLPDGKPLELPAGATGADAAAAIGPGLAKAALAIKVDGALRDLDAPLPEAGAEVAIVTDRDPEGLELIRHDAAHVMAEAVTELYPGDQGDDRPGDRVNGFYYDFEFPDGVRITEDDLPKIEKAMGKHIAADEHFSRRDVTVGEAIEIFGSQRGELQGRADRGPGQERRRGDRLALQERRLRGPLPRPALAGDGADQGDQAELGRGRLLARRRAPRAAHPHLRHRLLLEEGPRGPPRADRRGRSARPPPARPRARPLHAPSRGARHAVLAAQRHHAPAPDRRPGARAAAQARLQGDRDAAGARRGPLAPLGPLGQLQRRDVLHAGRRPQLRAAADELPRRLPRLRLRPPQLPRAAAAPRRVRPGQPQRARGRPPRPAPRPRLHPGRRPRLLHRGPDHRRGGLDLRGDRRALRAIRLRRRESRALHPSRQVDGDRRSSGRRRRRRWPRRSTARAASTS